MLPECIDVAFFQTVDNMQYEAKIRGFGCSDVSVCLRVGRSWNARVTGLFALTRRHLLRGVSESLTRRLAYYEYWAFGFFAYFVTYAPQNGLLEAAHPSASHDYEAGLARARDFQYASCRVTHFLELFNHNSFFLSPILRFIQDRVCVTVEHSEEGIPLLI